MMGSGAPAYAEQSLAHDEIDDEGDVDDERADLHVGDVLRQLVDLERDEKTGADDGDVLAPPLEAPQADAFGHLQHGIDDEKAFDEMQRAVLRVEQLMDLL